MQRKWDITDEQAKRRCIDEVIARVDEQDGEEFGMIAAQELIDIVSQYLGPVAYSAGVDEAKKALQAKVADLEVDLELLRQTS